jgi:hypothetical protein
MELVSAVTVTVADVGMARPIRVQVLMHINLL